MIENNGLSNNPIVELSIDVGYVDHSRRRPKYAKGIEESFCFQRHYRVILMVLSKLIYFTFEKDKIISQEGDKGNYFDIIAEEKVASCEKNKPLKKYAQWDCFGKLSLISKYKRQETVKCLTKVSLFS